MISPYRSWPPAAVAPTWLLVVWTVIAWPCVAGAAELAGHLSDAATGVPIAGATVRVRGTNQSTTTDASGAYEFDLPDGAYDLAIAAPVGARVIHSQYIRQRVPQRRPGRPRVYTDFFLNHDASPLAHPAGLPDASGRAPAGGPASVDLGGLNHLATHPDALTVSPGAATTIRVGRRQDPTGAQGCSGSANPIVAIDEMSLNEYVKGVLPAEIGVFRSIPHVREVYTAFAIAARSYALWFVLYYDADNRRQLDHSVDGFTWFHIDDTACNQRYSDDRLAITSEAAETVDDMFLVDAANPDNLEKYEYAASCGAHGTRPEHQRAIVADTPPVDACVGSWCGHDTCAGHADHPDVAGADRCLVRGICQWGAASWAQSGKSYEWILDHYQPNLEVRTIRPAQPDTVSLNGYAYTDPDDIAGSGVAGVHISIDNDQRAQTGPDGAYHIPAVKLAGSAVDIQATKSGYRRAGRSKILVDGEANWASIQMIRQSAGGQLDGGSDTNGDAGRADAPDRQRHPRVDPSPGIHDGCAAAPKPVAPRPLGPAAVAIAALAAVGIILR